ncbi:MAG: helix-turn-helix transcriptional regulator [Pararhizobium sp.]
MDLVLAGVKPISMFSSREKSAVGTILTASRKTVACKHIGHVFTRREGPRPETFISVTYPGKWLINYAVRSYFSIDPVINHSERTHRPIILQDLSQENGALRTMLADARRFGLGRSFVSFCVMPNSETPGSVMFSFDIEPAEFQPFFAANEARLREAARKIHLDILSARGLLGARAWAFDLTEREERCLAALANGRTFAEIAETMDGTPGDVSDMMRGICAKLDCSNSMQAVSRALALGLLDESDADALKPQQQNGFSPRRDVPPTRH